MKEVNLTRQELYDLVWTESMLTLSKKFAISDVGLRKKCKSLNIPVPNLGYWAKVKFGKKVPPRTPLGSSIGDKVVILSLREDTDELKDSRSKLLKELVSDENINIKVPEKLMNPDKLILEVKDDFYKRKVWGRDEGIVFSSQGYLDIRVSPKIIGRALLFMDTMIKALKQRGHELKIENGNTYLIIDGEKQPLCFREKLKRVIVKGQYYDSNVNQPTGLLSLKIDESYSHTEWADGKKSMEEQLPNIIISLELRARRMKEERLEREKYWEEQREEERKVKEIQDRKEEELKNFLDLFRNAKRHDNAEKIRRFADELERFTSAKNIFTDEIKDKIEWARKKADWYDPFIEADDEIMEGIDRDDLKLKKQTFLWLNK